jgi:predicted nuclease of restriction endonuclease-like (RecB) superfamily
MARKRAKTERVPAERQQGGSAPPTLLQDLRDLIQATRSGVAQGVNSALVLLYWQVGHRIRTEVLLNRRAEYGEQILPTLSAKLVPEYGQGFSERNLARMVRFAEVFPDREIVSTLSRQLGWSHFVEIIYLKTDLHREFYAEMCRVERWSVRTLRGKIGGMLFERTALSRKPRELAKQELAKLRESDQLSPDLVFRDPYFLDFLGLADAYSEKDLETAILREMEQFILELGVGFTFIARQKRIIIDGKDFYIDLLFYHRKLHRLIAIELKLAAFQAADKGQMELYLRWLEKHEMEPGEETPIGLILCEEKGEEQVELLQLDKSGIRVSSYLTDLPPRQLLRRKLHEASLTARARLEGRLSDEDADARGGHQD